MTIVTVVNSLADAQAIADSPPAGHEAMMWNAGYVVLDTRRDPPAINDDGNLVYTIRPRPPLARIEDWRVMFVPAGMLQEQSNGRAIPKR